MKNFFSIFNFVYLIAFLISFKPSNSLSQLTYPTRYPYAVIPHNGDGHRLFFLYMPMQYQDNAGQDTFKLYYLVSSDYNKRYLARSTNFGITWSDTQRVYTDSMYESIIKNPDSLRMYMGYNSWRIVNDTKRSFFYSMFSTDGGFNFSNKTQVMELGEDKSFIWNEDELKYWGYVRPRNIEPTCYGNPTYGNGVRKIALIKNSAFFPFANNWSARDTILEVYDSAYTNVNSPDYRTQTYYMQVFRNGTDWWGLVGMYRVANNGGENEPFPYTYPEYTSDVELVWSDNGEDWYRTNQRQPIIPLHDSIRTIYAVGTVVQDSVYIYSAESTVLHASYQLYGCFGVRQDSAVNGKYYSIYLYKIAVSKLNEWRPPSIVNITCTVEGFLNTSSGKHNLRDTLASELRSTTSPYSLVSSAKAIIDSVTFSGKFEYPHVTPNNYYLKIEGRNSLETWSASGIPIGNDSSSSYNFTSAGTKAYGSNLKFKAGKYCIFSGDVNNNGFIDLADVDTIYNDINNFISGYVDSDVNGDNYTDLTDVLITFNNSVDFISVIKP